MSRTSTCRVCDHSWIWPDYGMDSSGNVLGAPEHCPECGMEPWSEDYFVCESCGKLFETGEDGPFLDGNLNRGCEACTDPFERARTE